MTALRAPVLSGSFGLLDDASGVWITLGVVTVLAAVVAVLPLRDGNGRHAHARPSAVQPANTSPEGPGEIAWPSGDVSSVERGLADLLGETDLLECADRGSAPESCGESDYVGRHRLVEHDVYEPPVVAGGRCLVAA